MILSPHCSFTSYSSTSTLSSFSDHDVRYYFLFPASKLVKGVRDTPDNGELDYCCMCGHYLKCGAWHDMIRCIYWFLVGELLVLTTYLSWSVCVKCMCACVVHVYTQTCTIMCVCTYLFASNVCPPVCWWVSFAHVNTHATRCLSL